MTSLCRRSARLRRTFSRRWPSAAASRARTRSPAFSPAPSRSASITTASATPIVRADGQQFSGCSRNRGTSAAMSATTARCVVYKRYIPVKGLTVPTRTAAMSSATASSLSYIQGYRWATSPHRSTASTPAAKRTCVASTSVRQRPMRSFRPGSTFQLTNPDGSTVPRDPTNPSLGVITVPLPVYGIVSVGGDTSFLNNLEYRIPVAGPVDIPHLQRFWNRHRGAQDPAARKPRGYRPAELPALRLSGLHQWRLHGRHPGAVQHQDPADLRNQLSCRATPSVQSIGGMLPIVHAPLQLYYAYNPLRSVTRISWDRT